jgi:radical SAM protein with 4Fe4S-binding SPASM domain
METVIKVPKLNVEIEMSAFCQLKCPFCRTGGLKEKYKDKIKSGFLTKEVLEHILNKVPLNYASLFNWGEPFLNRNVIELTKMISQRGIGCELGTNLQIMTPELAEEVVQSGICKIYISCDGITQETYEKYRIGGSLEKLLANAKMLSDAKQKTNSPMDIFFQMVVNKYNHKEEKDFESWARQHGATGIRMGGLFGMTPEGWLQYDDFDSQDPRYSKRNFLGSVDFCEQPWNHLSFNWNGDIYNCCNPVGNERYKLGNICEISDINEVWNSQQMQYIRRFCSTRNPEKDSKIDIPCYRCYNIFPSEERKISDEHYPCLVKIGKQK